MSIIGILINTWQNGENYSHFTSCWEYTYWIWT